MKVITHCAITLSLALFSACLSAGDEAKFTTGPVFKDYGENVPIENGLPDAENQQFKLVFDVAKSNEPGQVNRNFNSVARFINMHVRAGVPEQSIDVAVVVHGKATLDLLKPKAFSAKFEQTNASSKLLTALMNQGVAIYLCGQSAHHWDVKPSDVMEGVKMSLSAMTANAVLQQQGYTLNPF